MRVLSDINSRTGDRAPGDSPGQTDGQGDLMIKRITKIDPGFSRQSQLSPGSGCVSGRGEPAPVRQADRAILTLHGMSTRLYGVII